MGIDEGGPYPRTSIDTVPTHAERKTAYENAGPPGVAEFVQIACESNGTRLALDAAGNVWESETDSPIWQRVRTDRSE